MAIDSGLIFNRRIVRVPPGDLTDVVHHFDTEDTASALFCNVHMLMLSLEDQELANAMARANYTFADGAPVAWLQRRIVPGRNRVVRGYEFMLELCRHAETTGAAIGLYGSSTRVLDALRRNLRNRHPNLEIPYYESPPFVADIPELSAGELQRMNSAHLSYLFVSLGCPKQEKWLARYSPFLNCHVLAVGAAFDWLAGTTPMPPKWMERTGLAWLHRLLLNPRSMWRRYLKYNSRFIYEVAKFLIFERSAPSNSQRSGE